MKSRRSFLYWQILNMTHVCVKYIWRFSVLFSSAILQNALVSWYDFAGIKHEHLKKKELGIRKSWDSWCYGKAERVPMPQSMGDSFPQLLWPKTELSRSQRGTQHWWLSGGNKQRRMWDLSYKAVCCVTLAPRRQCGLEVGRGALSLSVHTAQCGLMVVMRGHPRLEDR